MKPIMFEHEFRVTYCATSGHFQWWHSDGRKGSDPMRPHMSDEQALAIAESMHRRIDGERSSFFFQVED